MIIVRIFCDWNEKIGDEFISFYELEKDPDYNKLYRLTNDTDYTHCITLNNRQAPYGFNLKNVIGLCYEPPEIMKYSKNFIDYSKNFKNFLVPYTFNDMPSNWKHCYSFLHPHIFRVEGEYKKKKPMSLVLSWKKETELHKYRYKLAEEILKTKLPIDIYGNFKGLTNKKDDRIKGKYPHLGNEPFKDYFFSIAIENSQHDHYFTEKLLNPLLLNCNAVYMGCNKIDDYFDKGILSLSGKLTTDMMLIEDICMNIERYYEEIDTQTVLDRVSIKNVINEFIDP